MKKTVSIILAVLMTLSVFAVLAVNAAQLGDVTGDGKINNKDVVTLFRVVSGGTVNEYVEEACDYNNDGKLNNKDVVALFRYVSSGAGAEGPDPYIDENDPEWINGIKIGTREELLEFGRRVCGNIENYSGKTIWITSDIELDPDDTRTTNWTPLTTYMLKNSVINGAGHTISGMRMSVAQIDGSMGFIGVATNKITIKNLTFERAVLDGAPKHSGVVIGELNAGGQQIELSNVTVKGSTVSGIMGQAGNLEGISFRMGGLIGANIYSDTAYIHDCTVDDVYISGFHNICGLIGCTNDKQYKIENNTVKNANLMYSASYSKSYNATASRYFADPFYCVNNYWGEYHTDVDLSKGNKFGNIDSFDVANNIHYKDDEGKTDDFQGTFPVSGSQIRPKDKR
ncbi:MAG: dockerin type I repeat-containing protein [Clostridia bacterium]|nr:dockerin type I repeat-containing protein [Clostridia bacterium]